MGNQKKTTTNEHESTRIRDRGIIHEVRAFASPRYGDIEIESNSISKNSMELKVDLLAFALRPLRLNPTMS